MSQISRTGIGKSKRLQVHQRQSISVRQSSNAFIQSSFCEDCKAVDWSSLNPDLIERDEEVPWYKRTIRSVSTSHEQLLRSNCELCRAIALIKPPLLDDRNCDLIWCSLDPVCPPSNEKLEGYESCRVLLVPDPDDFYGYSSWQENGCLAVLSDAAQEDIGPRALQRDKIDFEFIKEHLNACERWHGVSCGVSEPRAIEGLRVINCSTGVVQTLPDDHRYFALSYVWGSPPEPSPPPSSPVLTRSPTAFPRVVRDAMSVTRSLGVDFLWVDKYCIDQDDPEGKMNMIGQMDVIYSKAHLTIIDGAGNDAHHGLPGVGDVLRPEQPDIVVPNSDVRLVYIPSPSVTQLRHAKWSTRAWTFQESYLSKRRLIFTPTQVLYLCNGAYEAEGLNLPMDTTLLGNRFLGQLHEEYLSRLLPNKEGWRLRSPVDSLYVAIEDYSSRRLSYASDSLNAILGVFRSFAAQQMPGGYPQHIRHLWGVPMSGHATRSNRIAFALLWVHLENPNCRPSSRREEFPSWSWTGWEGEVSFGFADALTPGTLTVCENSDKQDHEALGQSSFDIESDVPNQSNRISLFEHFSALIREQSRDHNINMQPRRLHITSQVVPLTFRQVTLSPMQADSGTTVSWLRSGKVTEKKRASGLLASFQVTENVCIALPPAWDGPMPYGNNLEGLVLQTEFAVGASGPMRHPRLAILILKNMGDCYERAGLINLDNHCAEWNLYARGVTYLGSHGAVLDEVAIPDLRVIDTLWYRQGVRKEICLV